MNKDNSDFENRFRRNAQMREQLERKLEIQNQGKTPEQVMQESYEATKAIIQAEKEAEQKEVKDRIGALRAIYNACVPKPSNRFK